MKQIRDITFYPYIENGIVKKACIVIYNDNSYEDYSYEAGLDVMDKYLLDNGINNKEEMAKNGVVKVLTSKKTAELIGSYGININNIKGIDTTDYASKSSEDEKKASFVEEDFKSDEIQEENEEGIQDDLVEGKESEENKSFLDKTKEKISKLFKKIRLKFIAAGLVIAVLAGGVHSCTRNSKIGEMKPVNTTEDTSDNGKDNNIFKRDYSNYSMSELISVTKNSNKKSTMSKAWDSIRNFNIAFASRHVNGEKKLVHSFGEEVTQYVTYNELSDQEIKDIYDDTKMSESTLNNSYNMALEVDIEAHSVQKESLGKTQLIDSNEGKNFYTKYENYMISFNCTDDVATKQSIATEFYDTLRSDMSFIVDGNQSDVPSYYNAVVPIVYSMERLAGSLNVNDLTDEEYANFENSRLNTLRTNKFQKVEEILKNSSNANDDPTYEDFLSRSSVELSNLSAYDLENRKGVADYDSIIVVLPKVDNISNTSQNNVSGNTNVSSGENNSSSEVATEETKPTKEQEQENEDGLQQALEEARKQQQLADEEVKMEEESIKQDQQEQINDVTNDSVINVSPEIDGSVEDGFPDPEQVISGVTPSEDGAGDDSTNKEEEDIVINSPIADQIYETEVESNTSELNSMLEDNKEQSTDNTKETAYVYTK